MRPVSNLFKNATWGPKDILVRYLGVRRAPEASALKTLKGRSAVCLTGFGLNMSEQIKQ